jgi:hypothetical protein
MDFETAMSKIENINNLLDKKLITGERADDMKARIMRSYEDSEIPERRLPNDIQHLPGRMIEGLVLFGRAIARGSEATYRHLEEQEQRAPKNQKSVIDLYNDIK